MSKSRDDGLNIEPVSGNVQPESKSNASELVRVTKEITKNIAALERDSKINKSAYQQAVKYLADTITTLSRASVTQLDNISSTDTLKFDDKTNEKKQDIPATHKVNANVFNNIRDMVIIDVLSQPNDKAKAQSIERWTSVIKEVLESSRDFNGAYAMLLGVSEFTLGDPAQNMAISDETKKTLADVTALGLGKNTKNMDRYQQLSQENQIFIPLFASYKARFSDLGEVVDEKNVVKIAEMAQAKKQIENQLQQVIDRNLALKSPQPNAVLMQAHENVISNYKKSILIAVAVNDLQSIKNDFEKYAANEGKKSPPSLYTVIADKLQAMMTEVKKLEALQHEKPEVALKSANQTIAHITDFQKFISDKKTDFEKFANNKKGDTFSMLRQILGSEDKLIKRLSDVAKVVNDAENLVNKKYVTPLKMEVEDHNYTIELAKKSAAESALIKQARKQEENAPIRGATRLQDDEKIEVKKEKERIEPKVEEKLKAEPVERKDKERIIDPDKDAKKIKKQKQKDYAGFDQERHRANAVTDPPQAPHVAAVQSEVKQNNPLKSGRYSLGESGDHLTNAQVEEMKLAAGKLDSPLPPVPKVTSEEKKSLSESGEHLTNDQVAAMVAKAGKYNPPLPDIPSNGKSKQPLQESPQGNSVKSRVAEIQAKIDNYRQQGQGRTILPSAQITASSQAKALPVTEVPAGPRPGPGRKS